MTKIFLGVHSTITFLINFFVAKYLCTFVDQQQIVYTELAKDNLLLADNVLCFEISVVIAFFANLLHFAFQTTLLRSIATFSFIYICTSYFILYGSLVNDLVIWMLSSALLLAIRPSDQIGSKRNQTFIGAIQTLLLSHYFFAGLWKLVSVRHYLSLDRLTLAVLDNYAFSVGEGSVGFSKLIQPILQNAPQILTLGVLLVIAFQISTIVPILTGRFLKFYGLLIIIFHCLVFVVHGIPFYYSPIAAYLFLVLAKDMTILESNIFVAK